MKNYSLSRLSYLVMIVLTIGFCSCSKKSGCYFSLNTGFETIKLTIDVHERVITEKSFHNNAEIAKAMIIACESE